MKRVSDGGWKSRKLHMLIFSMLLVTAVGLASAKYPSITVIYSTFCTTITGLVAFYFGANSAIKVFSKGDQESVESTPQQTPVAK